MKNIPEGKYKIEINQYFDKACNDPANNRYYIAVQDKNNRNYYGNNHVEESMTKNLNIPFWNIAKIYVSAYREHKKYCCIFLINKDDAINCANDVVDYINSQQKCSAKLLPIDTE